MLPPAPSAPPSLEGGLASPGVQECQGNQVRLLSGLSKACNCRLTWVRWTQTQPQGKGETAVQETLLGSDGLGKCGVSGIEDVCVCMGKGGQCGHIVGAWQ